MKVEKVSEPRYAIELSKQELDWLYEDVPGGYGMDSDDRGRFYIELNERIEAVLDEQ